ncbi:MAG: [NiFe]-hydrogenase assembly chaperone HybE [Gammaproteobacteria bacterium]|nr:[NiFe]-hydrogenase assembly chaperone HybE [Gammaproteobacteria bacterium]
MNERALAAEKLEQTFNRILHEQMAGIPILNNRLKVQTLGLQMFEGRIMGILITPWLMSLVMLPAESDDWNALQAGATQSHSFPSNTFQFVINEFDGIGKCQTYSLFSPMSEFANQDHALAAAQSFLDTLMVETEQTEDNVVDDEQFARIMRGDETPEVLEAGETGIGVRETPEMNIQEKKLSRRDLLRGSFLTEV